MALTSLDTNTALVVVDVMNGVLAAPGTPHSTADVLARTAELADAFRRHNAPVVLVRVADPAGPDAVPGRTETPRRGFAMPDGWDLFPDTLTAADDLVVTKRNWSAFHGTDLDTRLRRRGVTQVVLTGFATSIGVESTARSAYEHGYHVTLAVDAMSDLDADAHDNSVRRIFPRLGETGTTAEIVELLAKTRS